MSIFLPVIFFVLVLLFIPIRIEIVLNAKLKDDKAEFEPLPAFKNYIKIKVLFFLQIFKKDIFVKKQKPKEKRRKDKTKKILFKSIYNSIHFDKFILSLGINTFNPILNSYINAGLNTGICMYINKENRKFSFNKLYYQIYLSDAPCTVNTDIAICFFPFKFLCEYVGRKLKEKKCISSKSSKECIS